MASKYTDAQLNLYRKVFRRVASSNLMRLNMASMPDVATSFFHNFVSYDTDKFLHILQRYNDQGSLEDCLKVLHDTFVIVEKDDNEPLVFGETSVAWARFYGCHANLGTLSQEEIERYVEMHSVTANGGDSSVVGAKGEKIEGINFDEDGEEFDVNYYYHRLAEMLYGSEDGTIDSNHSPNNVKSLVLGSTFILVVFHTGGFEYEYLGDSFEEHMVNLMEMPGVMPLSNLLEMRKFGCIEEIYADYRFWQAILKDSYLGLVSFLPQYKRDTRLRKFVWFDTLNTEDCVGALVGNTVNNIGKSKEFYTYGVFDTPQIGEVLSVREEEKYNENTWLTTHDLRPGNYPLDEKLKAYFERVESDLSSDIDDADKVQTIQGLLNREDIYINRSDYDAYVKMMKVSDKYCGDVGSIVYNHFFAIKADVSIKVYTGIEDTSGRSELSYAKERAEVITQGSRVSIVDVKDVDSETLSYVLNGGETINGVKSCYYYRIKNLVELCRSNEKLFISMSLVMQMLGLLKDYNADVDAMLKCIDDIVNTSVFSKAGDWFKIFNSIIEGILGFGGNSNVVEFAKRVSNGGAN